jgi:OOP family OmpA-OmpF porin
MKRLISLLALAAIAAANSAAVAETGLYGGLGIGGSKIEADFALSDGEDTFAIDFDEYDVSFKAFAGYRLLDWLAVEGGWYYLGEPDGSAAAVDPSTRITTEIELDGWVADAVAFWRFQEQWELFGKVGVISWNSDVTVQSKVDANNSPSGNPPVADTVFSDDENGEDIKYGAGVNYLHDDNLALRGEFEYFDIDGTDAVWLLSFSAIWRFN